MALQKIHLDLAPAGLHLASPSAWKRWGFTREWVFQHNPLKICCRDNDPIYATVLHTMFLMPRLQLLSSFQLSPTLSDYHANGEWFNSLDLNSLCPWLSDSKEISRRLLIWTWEPHQCPHKHDVNGRKSREQLGTQTDADTVAIDADVQPNFQVRFGFWVLRCSNSKRSKQSQGGPLCQLSHADIMLGHWTHNVYYHVAFKSLNLTLLQNWNSYSSNSWRSCSWNIWRDQCFISVKYTV